MTTYKATHPKKDLSVLKKPKKSPIRKGKTKKRGTFTFWDSGPPNRPPRENGLTQTDSKSEHNRLRRGRSDARNGIPRKNQTRHDAMQGKSWRGSSFTKYFIERYFKVNTENLQ